MDWDEAKHLVQTVEDAFGAADLAAIERGFTEDAVARFADFPELRGRDAFMAFLRARFARTQGYKLRKTLHCVMGDTLANTWDASWQDARTGKAMLGRGTEIWIVSNGRIAMWTQPSTPGRKAAHRRHRWCDYAGSGRAPSAPAPLRVDEGAQDGIHAGLISRAAVPKPVENVLIDAKRDRLLGLRPGNFQVGPVRLPLSRGLGLRFRPCRLPAARTGHLRLHCWHAVHTSVSCWRQASCLGSASLTVH